MRSLSSWLYPILVSALVGVIAALSLLLWAPQIAQPQSQNTPNSLPIPASGPVSYADAVARAAPAVVNIYTRTIVRREAHPIFDDPLFQRFLGINPQPNQRIQSSLGSGVIMSADGFVLTNNHVIKGADEIVVAMRDGREANAKVIGTDPDSDLALLKIEISNLPAIQISKHESRIGDVVLAIGNPYGVGQTVTSGIISATGRNHVGLNLYEDYIQTDAAINPGNSGGALINAHGELVGINTGIFSKTGGSHGIGFAIPAENAVRTMADLSQYGRVIRGWLGIEVQESTPALLEALDLPKELTGLIVTWITPNGPAEKAGLNIGDIILEINKTNADNARGAMNLIAAVRPGENISLVYLRAGKRVETIAVAGQRKPAASSQQQ